LNLRVQRTHKSIIPLFNFQRANQKRAVTFKPTSFPCQELFSIFFHPKPISFGLEGISTSTRPALSS